MLKITLPLEIQETIHQALVQAGSRECGGVLMGEHVGHNHFAVRAVTVQKAGGFAWFVRSVANAVQAVRRFLSAKGNDFRRFNYLGEWHSHPSFSVNPSQKDNDTMRRMAADPAVGANFLVLVIFRLDPGTLVGSAHTYLPDGRMLPSTLDWEAPE
ncbi:MAG: Mov34/MPN/PAD-1 family protein [Pseudomonadota bacterium]